LAKQVEKVEKKMALGQSPNLYKKGKETCKSPAKITAKKKKGLK